MEKTAIRASGLPIENDRMLARQRYEALEAELRETTARLRRAEEELNWKNAFLEAQANSSIDGIIVVDQHGRKILQNQRIAELFNIPPDIANDPDDAKQVQWVMNVTRHPRQFIERVDYLYAHPNEVSRDEIELTDGKVLDRYSSPVLGQDGKYYGRIWTFRDITERRQSEESLRLLSSAVEQSKESIVITDADFDLPGPRILFVNPAFTQMTGYTAEEALGKTPRILQGPRTDRAELRRLRANLERGEAFAGESVNYRKDGTEFDIEWQVAPIRNASGKTTHFVAIQRDITARKQAEKALRESNEKFLQLANHISDAFWVRSPDMREVHYVSPAFEQIWGRPVATLYEQPQKWADFIFPEDRERVLAAFAALTRDAPSLDIEYRILRPNGEIRWVRVRGFQVRDGGDQLIRHAGIVADITERKLVEAQLFQSQKMETVGKLAGGIAHEFNNVLTVILGQSELLLADLPPGSAMAGSVTEIHEAAGRVAALTRQLLAYGRKQFLQPATLDLNKVVAGMDGMLRHLMGDAVELRVIPATDLRLVKADAGQIQQVIVNIADNARDAMPCGGKLILETANVSFDLDNPGRHPELKPGAYVMLTITDTGTGMSEAVKARIFEPFFTTKEVGQGTGLGLSTCYGILKQSGGHLGVHTVLGRGTTFKIYLPQLELPKDDRSAQSP